MSRMREDQALKPVGLAFAAVVAGLSGQHAAVAAEPGVDLEKTRAFAVDPTNNPGFEEDSAMILGPSAPVEPFAEKPQPKQPGLFD